MTTIEFFVPGEAHGRDTGQTKDGRHYTTTEGRRWRERIAAYALACPDRPTGEPFLGPVSVTMIFMLQRPATHLRKGGLLSAAGRRFSRPTGRPDASNLLKTVEDVFSAKTKQRRRGLGWWRDDAQIVGLLAEKQWADPGAQPGVHVTVRFHDDAEVAPGATGTPLTGRAEEWRGKPSA